MREGLRRTHRLRWRQQRKRCATLIQGDFAPADSFSVTSDNVQTPSFKIARNTIIQRGRCRDAKKRCICPDRRDSATLHFTLKTNLTSSIGIFGLILLVFPIFLPAQALAAGNAADAKLS